ncbi:MAG: hypothetical protein A2W91_04520 [Bacteroidetes bacterium GWF2_38_335]|nr:MAG: hypothetical protein A2W91_04520 [Bacteroidetes bacterium GWF2_38_335]HBS88228.1 hypothetical protein [Bacteroidales bacterium]
MIENFTKIKTFTLVLFIGLFPCFSFSQLYYPGEIMHFNTSINPSAATSTTANKLLRFSHTGFPFNSGAYRSTYLQYSKSFPSIFSGAGVLFENQYYGKNKSYSYTSLSLAYRNVIFNQAFISIGIAPKYIRVNAPGGYFENYSFFENETGYSQNNLNFNLSLSVFSEKDSYFLSAGIVNYIPEFMQLSENRNFPVYRFINVGNIYKFFKQGTTNTRLFFTYFNLMDLNEVLRNSYSITFSTPIRLTRMATWIPGIFVCYSDNSVLDLSPVITFSKRMGIGIVNYRLSAVTSYDCTDYTTLYKMKVQFSINYNFR